MALHIDRNGVQNNIDIRVDRAIQVWGADPAHADSFDFTELLGGHYSYKRVQDGRILFFELYPGIEPNVPGGEVLLTKDESSHVLTDTEIIAAGAQANLVAEHSINNLSASDFSMRINDHGSAELFCMALKSNLYGTSLLIVILLAEKMSPREIWKKTGYGASLFLAEFERLKGLDIFQAQNAEASNHS